MSDAGTYNTQPCKGDRDERLSHTQWIENSVHNGVTQSKEGGTEREELATCVNLPVLGMM